MYKRVIRKVLIGLTVAVTSLSLFGPLANATHRPNHGGGGGGGCDPASGRIEVFVGGSCNSIQAAVDAAPGTAANPVIIDVLPGTYTENVVMKSYVHLKGSGPEVTFIQSPSIMGDVIAMDGLTNNSVSGLNLSLGRYGIRTFSSSNVTIMNNSILGNDFYGIILDSSPSVIISGNNISGNVQGVHNINSEPTITDNIISENTINGLVNVTSSSPRIKGNIISGNGGDGLRNTSSPSIISGNTITGNGARGIYVVSSSPTIRGNTITGNNDYGIYNQNSSASTIIHNRITGNGVGTITDIFVDSPGVPNISFNVYDDITGTNGVGDYNINSNGAPAPAP